jgi:biopolymer transport protein ExbD
LILTITDSGSVYFGSEPTTPSALTEKVRRRLSSREQQKLYIKADARTQYASVATVLDAVRMAGVEAPALLTSQPDWSRPGTIVPPRGLEVLIGSSTISGSDSVVVQVMSSGHRRPTVTIGNRQIAWSSLQHNLTRTFQKHNEKAVAVKADEMLPFAQVAHVIDVCRSTGASVVLITPRL